MSAFTPGPWRLATPEELEGVSEYRPHVVAPGPFFVAAVYDSVDDYAANARLLAAAPDGYALAARLVKFFGDVPPAELPLMVMEDPSVLTQFVDAARAFIAKAEDRPADLKTGPQENP